MKAETLKRAIEIMNRRERLQSELRNWHFYASEGIAFPLAFRMGSHIEHMSIEAFNKFRAENIEWLNAEISKLDSELEKL